MNEIWKIQINILEIYFYLFIYLAMGGVHGNHDIVSKILTKSNCLMFCVAA